MKTEQQEDRLFTPMGEEIAKQQAQMLLEREQQVLEAERLGRTEPEPERNDKPVENEPIEENEGDEPNTEIEPEIAAKSNMENRLRKRDTYAEKYALHNELASLKQKVAKQEAELQESFKISSDIYSRNIQARIDQIYEEGERAVLANDTRGLLKAQQDLTRATIEMERLNQIAQPNVAPSVPPIPMQQQVPLAQQPNQNYYDNVPPPPNYEAAHYQDVEALKNNMTTDWLADNPELSPTTKYYDETLTNNMIGIANNLNAELMRRGQSYLIRSPEYFDRLDYELDNLRNYKTQGSKMPKTHVGAVNNVSKRAETTTTRLTPDQAETARLLNLSPAEYLKSEKEAVKKFGKR